MTDPNAQDIYGQAGFDCRMDWGLRGVMDAAERGDVIVLVDVLSFTSTTTTAASFDIDIYPHPMHESAAAFAAHVGAELRLGDAVPKGKRSLSPSLFGSVDRGKRFVLCSLNGATCAHAAPHVPALFAGCLLNASAVAAAADCARADAGASVTVVACGEKWNDPREGEDALRPCIEDYLGAGAILAALTGSRSPEAQVCATALEGLRAQLEALVWESASGRELRAGGFEEDVRQCGRLDVYDAVPILIDRRFTPLVPR